VGQTHSKHLYAIIGSGLLKTDSKYFLRIKMRKHGKELASGGSGQWQKKQNDHSLFDLASMVRSHEYTFQVCVHRFPPFVCFGSLLIPICDDF